MIPIPSQGRIEHRRWIIGLGLLFLALVITGCSGRSAPRVGFTAIENKEHYRDEGRSNRSGPEGTEVVLVSYYEALDLAERASYRTPHQVAIDERRGVIRLTGTSAMMGNSRTQIYPVAFEDQETKQRGYSYKASYKGFGLNASMAPGYVASDFYTQMGQLVIEEEVPRAVFKTAEVLAGPGPGRPQIAGPPEPTASGTCWAVGPNHLLSNSHVVGHAQKVYVGLPDGLITEAQVIHNDPSGDIALLEIASTVEPLPVVTRGVGNGTEILAIGFPLTDQLGVDHRVTRGIISAQGGFRGDVTHYQMDAAVYGGNSGGPVLNQRGQVVGMVVSGLAQDDRSREVENINFAIKSVHLIPPCMEHAVEYKPAQEEREEHSSADIAAIAERSVFPLYRSNPIREAAPSEDE